MQARLWLGPGVLLTPNTHPRPCPPAGNDFFWAVWHAPPAPPPDDVPIGGLAAGQLGALMLCAAHQPSAAFQSEYLPFMDQYANSLQLWSPGSDAFCYAAVDQVPRECRQAAGAGPAGWWPRQGHAATAEY